MVYCTVHQQYMCKYTWYTTTTMRKWTRESIALACMRAPDKRKVARERCEARRRAVEEEKKEEQE